MTFLITVALTFVVVTIALWVFWKLGPPVYRLEMHNVITLLEMVVEGRATDSDWDVFTGFPIHYDPELAEIQRRCIAIAEREYIGGEGLLFSSEGCREIGAVLNELKAKQALIDKTD